MPQGRRGPWTVAVALVLAGSGTAHAQLGLSLNRAGSGARAAGMGDAFIAVSDDGTAASWNPAGLAQLRQPEFSAVYGISHRGLQFTGLRSRDQSIGYSSQDFRYTDSSLEFASAAIPFTLARKPCTVQAGWHRLYQLSGDISGTVQRIPLVPPGPAQVLSRDDHLVGDIDLYSVSAAVKLTGRLALGANVDILSGGWTERFTFAEQTADGGSEFATRNTTQDLGGHTFSGGLLLTYPAWNAGIVYHAPFWSRFDSGEQQLSSRTPPLSGTVIGPRFRFPRSVGAGLAHRFASRWTAAVSVTHDEWTRAIIDRIPGREPINFFDGLPPAVSTTRDTTSVNFGIEHLVLREGSVVPVRLGLGWEPQGGMDRWTRDPVNYLLLTAGTGYNTNRFKFDAALQYRRGTFGVSQAFSVANLLVDAMPPDAVGRASAQEWRLKVSAIYRVQDVDTLRGILRRIFG